jgi:hypothetical protein
VTGITGWLRGKLLTAKVAKKTREGRRGNLCSDGIKSGQGILRLREERLTAESAEKKRRVRRGNPCERDLTAGYAESF